MLSFDGIPEETDAERAWRQARAAKAPVPEAVEDDEDHPTPPADIERFVQQLIRWGGMSPTSAENAILDGLKSP